MSPMWWTVFGTVLFGAGMFLGFEVLDALARPPVNTSLRAMLGRVQRPIGARAGQVDLGGELWSAQSLGTAIPPGRWVRVLSRRGHTLMVAPVDESPTERAPSALPNGPRTGAGRRRAGRTAGWSSDPGLRGVGPRRLGRARHDGPAPR